jgi:hypothetical protein
MAGIFDALAGLGAVGSTGAEGLFGGAIAGDQYATHRAYMDAQTQAMQLNNQMRQLEILRQQNFAKALPSLPGILADVNRPQITGLQMLPPSPPGMNPLIPPGTGAYRPGLATPPAAPPSHFMNVPTPPTYGEMIDRASRANPAVIQTILPELLRERLQMVAPPKPLDPYTQRLREAQIAETQARTTLHGAQTEHQRLLPRVPDPSLTQSYGALFNKMLAGTATPQEAALFREFHAAGRAAGAPYAGSPQRPNNAYQTILGSDGRPHRFLVRTSTDPQGKSQVEHIDLGIAPGALTTGAGARGDTEQVTTTEDIVKPQEYKQNTPEFRTVQSFLPLAVTELTNFVGAHGGNFNTPKDAYFKDPASGKPVLKTDAIRGFIKKKYGLDVNVRWDDKMGQFVLMRAGTVEKRVPRTRSVVKGAPGVYERTQPQAEPESESDQPEGE